MKKYFHLLLFLFTLVGSFSCLAQSLHPFQLLDLENGTSSQEYPTSHLEATYKILSKKSEPLGSLTWVADLKNEVAPYIYQVTVTLENNTDEVFGTWNVGVFFLGSVGTKMIKKMVDDPNNPGQKKEGYVSDWDISQNIRLIGGMFSNGPASGYAIFSGTQEQGTQDLSSHGKITFQYAYQLPPSQTTVMVPAKIILSRGISYLMTPEVSKAPDDAVSNPPGVIIGVDPGNTPGIDPGNPGNKIIGKPDESIVTQ